MRCLPKMWMQETFSYQGEFWSMPERTILPKPYQKPHPPMWVAVTSPGTEIDAAERGLGSLGLSFAGFDEQEKKIKEYRRRIQQCEPVGAFVNEQVATTNFLFCHEDDEDGVEMGKRLGNTFNYLATQLISTREVYLLAVLPVARPAAGAAPRRDRPRRQRAADRGHGLRRSRAHHPRRARSGSRSASTASTSSSTPTRSCRRTR